jgi:cytochrome P450
VTADAALAAGFDLAALTDAYFDDPYPTYRALRLNEPVKRLPDGSYFLTRYADLEAIYRQPALFSSDKREVFAPKLGDGLSYQHHTTSLVFNDPPLHSQVRRIMQGALTPRAIARMESGLAALVDGLLDRAEARGAFDLIADFAAAIPLEVIGNLLDIPHADRGPLRDWSLAILGVLEPVVTPEMLARSERALADFLAYLDALIEDRARRPGDPETDVLTRLMTPDKDGARLDRPTLLHNCVFLLNAGHETTTNLIGNALVTLLDWPQEKARLIADPGLIDGAIEEALRFESSNQLGNRRAVEDAVIGGTRVPAGSYLHLCIGAANRDPERFADPDRFDIGRSPNRHLAFASGPHMCLGLSLARLEGRIAVGRFLARFPHYALAGAPVRMRRARFRGFASVPIAACQGGAVRGD